MFLSIRVAIVMVAHHSNKKILRNTYFTKVNIKKMGSMRCISKIIYNEEVNFCRKRGGSRNWD